MTKHDKIHLHASTKDPGRVVEVLIREGIPEGTRQSKVGRICQIGMFYITIHA